MLLNPYRFASAGASTTYVGGDFLSNTSSTTYPLALPGGILAGDLMLVILRCREDRTFTVPGGWTTVYNQTVPFGSGGTSNSRFYVITKTRAAETTLSFTQSVSAGASACVLVFRGGSILAQSITDTTGLGSISKTISSSLIVVAFLFSNKSGAVTANPNFTGFTQRGIADFDSAGTRFYGTVAETRAGLSSGTVNVSSATGSPQQGVLMLEIG